MTITETEIPMGHTRTCRECGEKREYGRIYHLMVGNAATNLCHQCVARLRHELSKAAYPCEGVTVRMNKDDEGNDTDTVDEVYADRAFIGFEQMSASCYWLTVQKDGARLDIDFWAEVDDDPNRDPEDGGVKITAKVREQYVTD